MARQIKLTRQKYGMVKCMRSFKSTVTPVLLSLTFLLASTLVGVNCNRGYAYIDPDIEDAIDAFVEKTLSCREIVGLNLAVVKGNKTLIAKGYGTADLDKQSFVDESTLFGIASLTKAFASTLLGILIDESDSFTWDTSVRSILGEDFYFHDALRSEETTLRDLLTHRTGIPPNNYARLQSLNREELAKKMRFFEAADDFRSSYVYNNLMYGLISYISEIIGGKSWEELMHEKIFGPLGMTSTTFTHTTNLSRTDLAVPYLPYDSSYRPVSLALHSDWGELGGSGSIMTTSLDITRWLKMQINLGVSGEGRRVAPTVVMEESHRAQNVIDETTGTRVYRKPYAPVSYTFNQYALGWRTGTYRGYPIVTHTGTSWGYGAILTLVPDFDLAIHTSITGSDTGYKGRRNIHMYIMDLLMDKVPWLNLTSCCTFPDTKKRKYQNFKQKTHAQLPLEKYTGIYGNFGYGNITVFLPEGSERLRMSYGPLGLWDLYPTMVPNKFLADGLDHVWSMDLANLWFETRFDRDEDIVVERLIIASFENRKPPVFVRDLKMEEAPDPPQLCQMKDNLWRGKDSDTNKQLDSEEMMNDIYPAILESRAEASSSGANWGKVSWTQTGILFSTLVFFVWL